MRVWLCVILLLCPLTLAADRVFCDDPQAAADWERQAAEYRDDPAVQTLHGLWLGLCQKIRAGTIDQDLAIELFERERARQALERARNEAELRARVGT